MEVPEPWSWFTSKTSCLQGETQTWGFSLNSWVGLQEVQFVGGGDPLYVFLLLVPWVSFSAVMRPSGLESFALKWGVMREFWQREQGFTLFHKTGRSFYFKSKNYGIKKLKRRCYTDCKPWSECRSPLHTLFIRVVHPEVVNFTLMTVWWRNH